MKIQKKFFALLTALALCASMGNVPVMADGAVSADQENDSLYYNLDIDPLDPNKNFTSLPPVYTPFKDVSVDKYYADAVTWAKAAKVTGGTSATQFSPDRTCTRGQIVTFLYKKAGEPSVEVSSNGLPFTDVAANKYYAPAVRWAAATGITGGTTPTTFSPDAPCTRAQIVSFLYRAAGSPEVTGESPFSDVSNQYFAKAVLWAKENQVTGGKTASTFAPQERCTRAQAVTFLYKTAGDVWTITQYAGTSGGQCSIYMIVNAKGQMAIIDGGYTQDADFVRALIKAHGNHVSDWILTHPHPDHIGAFNAIMRDNAGGRIRVDHIYATQTNEERYRATARGYDRIEAYDDFLTVAKTLNYVTYLKEDDTVDILGLTMKVLHGWDKDVDRLSLHLANNGSLMFKLSGAEKSMLFCADTQKEVEKDVLLRHKDEVSANYVECSHHGNWGLSPSFYINVHASEAFIDAPTWLLENTTEGYDAYALKKALEDMHMNVHYFNTAPNSVILD